MADAYYVRIRGRVSGPFSTEKLMQLAQRGQLSRTHEVSEDSANWFSAGQLEQLFAKRAGTAKITPASMPQAAESTVTPPPASTSGWFVAIGGSKQGPFTENQLHSLIAAGNIDSMTLVWTEGYADWLPAATVPGLFSGHNGRQSHADEQLKWSELLPVFRLFNDGSWARPWVVCLAIALLFPLLVIEYQGVENVDLVGASVAFSLYFSLLWTAFFHWCIDPGRLGAIRLLGTWLLTATIGVLGVVLVQALALPIFIDGMAIDNEASLLKRVISWTLAVGVIEEAGKLAAVLLLTLRMPGSATPRTYAYLGVVSGLAFGTVEAIIYTYAYATEHAAGSGDSETSYGWLFMALITRWISLPLLHAIWTGIAGYFVGLSRKASQSHWKWILFGLTVVALLHGIYDVGAGDERYSWLALSTATVSLALFIGYLRSEELLVDKIRSHESSRRTQSVAS
ncbi:GYF domain-containing protein [Aeoliella sp. SH292]|uniref:GYF domain-containing protein n=1 Tax=Aeoliella sp. SH292 TaxID=3454464 RepID=UPI003F96CFF6